MTQASHSHLRKQLKMLTEKPVAGFRVELVDDNLEKWRVWIRGPKGSPYEGGFFRALLEFPADFPFQPPSMRFESKFWHPNVYPDGRVCISILHPPGEDEFGYEQASERWTPIQSIESVLISVILMISDPNDESPANLDAALQWRKTLPLFKERVQQCVAQSLRELPADFEPPKDFDEAPTKPEEPTRMVRDDSVASMNYEEDDMDYDDEEEEGVDPEDKRKYAEQLRQLADMGCTDTARAIQVLKEVKGEMERALDKLFNS